MNKKSNAGNIISWIFVAIFFALGILNLIYVHLVPGLFYLLFGLIYLPTTNVLLKKKLGFTIPLLVKIIVGIVLLWATLAVGDLMELFEAWLGH